MLADVPGLFLQYRYGNDVRISIRGFGTRSNSGVRGIRILQDGIPESEPDGETAIDAIDFTSLGGVEVVKGNLSSLYTNSPGGVVNFLSDISFNENFVRMTNEIGEYGMRQNGLKVGLAGKNYRFFISYSYRNFKGFRPHNTEYIHLINSVYQEYIDSKTSFSIFANFVNGFIRIPGSLTQTEFSVDPFQAWEYAVSSDFKRETKKGRIAVRFLKSFKNSEFEFTGFVGLKDIEMIPDPAQYQLITKYKIGTTVRFVNKTPIKKFDNEISMGIDLFYLKGPVSVYNNVGGVKGDELQTQLSEELSNLGFYFQDQFGIVKDKLYILFSGRYDKLYYISDDNLFEARSSKRSFQRFTPKFAMNYKLTPLISVYTSYGLGFDTPSSTELENSPFSSNGGSTTLNPDLNPQYSYNYELGIKGNILNKKSEFFKSFSLNLLFSTQR